MRLPPPLDEWLRLDADGRVWDDHALVAEVRDGAVGLAPPEPVSWDDAVAAAGARSRLAVPALLRLRSCARRRAAHPCRAGRGSRRRRGALAGGGGHGRAGVRLGRARLPRRLRDRRDRSRRRRARTVDGAGRARAAGRRALRRRRLVAGQRRGGSTAPGRRSSPRQASCSGSRAPSGSSRAADRTSPSTTSQSVVAVDSELDALAEVDRLAVLEHGAQAAAEPSREDLLERRPVRGVVHVPEPVDVGHAQRPLPRRRNRAAPAASGGSRRGVPAADSP